MDPNKLKKKLLGLLPSAKNSGVVEPVKETNDKKSEGLSGEGLDAVFQVLYKFTMVASVSFVIAMFLLSFVDIMTLMGKQLNQYQNTQLNPYVFLKDSLEYQILQSYVKNKSEDEVFNVITQVTLLNGVFVLCGFGLFALIGLQILINMITSIYCSTHKDKCSSAKVKIVTPVKNTLVMVIILGFAFILNVVYSYQFVRDIQPTVLTTFNRLSNIKRLVYANMTSTISFLSALTSDNMAGCIKHMKQIINSVSKTDGEKVDDITKCLTTIGIYMNYRYNISDMDDEFSTVMSMFSYNGIKKRTVDPVQYMFIGKPFQIPDVFAAMTPYIMEDLRNKNMDQNVQALYIHRMDELNRAMLGISTLQKLKSKVSGLLVAFFFVLAALIAILVFLLKGDIKSMVQSAKAVAAGAGEREGAGAGEGAGEGEGKEEEGGRRKGEGKEES